MSYGANKSLGFAAATIVIFTILGCDSPPWSRCLIVNKTSSEMTIKFYTPYPQVAHPCVYSPEDWSQGAKSCTFRADQALSRNDQENWFEGRILPGGAVEIDRARYPDIEEEPEQNFLIDRLDIHGSAGDISWVGRREIFGKLKKEEGGTLPRIITGGSPNYVYDYK